MSKVKTFSIGHFELNPRGTLWANDKSGLGRRLLHRMGWSEGQGLGKKEDGIACPIRPQTTRGNRGLGFTEKLNFFKESHEYDSVLENLNKKFQTSSESKKVEEKGLEQRCQQFKKRLHYRKFVRGKDVGRYSQKDMAAIFVTRKGKTSTEKSEGEGSDVASPPTFQSSLSINDYFARKMQDKKIGLKKESPPGQKKKLLPAEDIELTCKKRTMTSDSDTEAPSKKTSLPSQDTETSDTDSEAPVEVSNLSTRKRKPLPSDKTEPSCKKRTMTSNLDPETPSKKISLSQDTEAPLKNIPSDPNIETPNEVSSSTIQPDSKAPIEVDSEPSTEVGSLPNQEDSEVAPCLELPRSGGRYNEWLESQRTASRMRLYRGMVRRLSAHPVLRTSNLTHIKGYGNNQR